jgi:hypothetical protein
MLATEPYPKPIQLQDRRRLRSSKPHLTQKGGYPDLKTVACGFSVGLLERITLSKPLD